MLGAGMSRRRIDTVLVSRGLAESREKARVMVMEGSVIVDKRTVIKPSELVSDEVDLELVAGPPYVGRGGLKLEGALGEFRLDVSGWAVLDVGASTGGFTDCLLKHGAGKVYAVDVGYGQLDYRLRKDPRVVTMERVNARHPFQLPEMVDLATLDLSFISLQKVVPNVSGMVRDRGLLLTLVKPQFEAGRQEVGRGGVVKDPLVHASVLGRFVCWAVDRGFKLEGLAASPLRGADGNREFFVLLRNP
jgi:23S rRNA (cytidine1920-2'-O)/16S rRNA (cytidine1409-2'-O)-methyltransferase